MRALILASDTRADFVKLEADVARGSKIVQERYATDNGVKDLVALYKHSAANLAPHYDKQLKTAFTWLGNDESYAYVKQLYTLGRMKAFRGNMLDSHAMQSIAASAKKMRVPM